MSVLAAVLRNDASYDAVLTAAAALAGSDAFEVLSLHAQPNPGEISFQSSADLEARATEAMARQLRADVSARGLNATVQVQSSRMGQLGDAIVARAQEVGARVIVIGTQGRTGLSRLFMGSVADRVVHHATCDVYVIRPRKSA